MDKKILVVDDEEEIRMVLRETLVSVGYKIFEAANAVEALSRIEKESFNLIILDLVMPETSGFEFLKQIRKTSNVPVIVLSGKTDTGDKVESLMLGADDYITKPWKMVELNARISAVLRRTEKIDYNASQLFNDGRLAIDCVKRSVPLGGNEIHLTLKEYELLQKLVCVRKPCFHLPRGKKPI